MGRHAARNIRLRGLRGQPLRPFRYRDKGSSRRSAAARRSPRSAGGSSSRDSSPGCAWLFIHIFFLIGFRNRVLVMLPVGLVVPDLPTAAPA